jgi:ferredoxin
MKVIYEKCKKCAACIDVCPVRAISLREDEKAVIDKEICLDCGCCASSCPNKAIEYE